MKALIDFKKVEKISKALADSHRLSIIEAIRKEECWHGCCDMGRVVNLSQPATSHHLKMLVDAELITQEKEGRTVKYTINNDVFAAYASYLSSFQK